MANNRSGISHPALNASGGSALWTSIDNIYQLFSDQDVGRWVDFTALANSAKVTVTHSFGVSFDDLKVVVYTGTYPNLTQVQNFTVAATTGFEKTKIDVTAPASGGPFSGYVLVVHNAAMQERVLTTAQRLALASPTSGMKVYDSDLGKVVYYNGTAWKVPADLDTAETLSNKTLAAPVFNTFSVFNQTSTPVTAAAGTVRVYAKADNKLYKMDSTGAEASIGSGSGSGGVNYVVDWYDGTKPITAMNSTTANGNILVANIAAPNNYSTWYADGTSAAPVNAGSFVTGATYIITTVGTTNFVAVGAASNTVGVVFTATGAGSGTGTVIISAAFSSSNTSLRGSSNYLTQLSGASTSGATFVQTPAFNVDAFDLGKPVTISFDLTGVTTADDWDVVAVRYTTSSTLAVYAELIPIAGTASSITGTPGAQLPTGTTQFKGFFIPSSTATDVYALRFRRRTGSTQIRIDSLTVGPQSLAQGAVVTAWQAYTPIFTNETGGTFSWTSGYPLAMWRRVGNVLEGSIVFNVTGVVGSGRVSISYPSGLTKDDSIISLSLQKGTWSSEDFSSASAVLFQPLRLNTSNIQLINSGSTDDNLRSEQLIAGKNYKLDFSIPVSQWSSGTTTLADRAVEEYVYSTDTSNTNALSSFGYGPQGSLFPQAAVSSTNIDKIVQFTNPILATDNIFLEVSGDSGLTWSNLNGLSDDLDVQPLTRQTAGINYGVSVTATSATQARVRFGRYKREAGGVYGAAGVEWGVQTTRRWRVRKVSGGAAVGFPVSARNIVGDTSGTVVPTGMIGETKTISQPSNTNFPASDVFGDIGSFQLTPGIWLLSASMSYSMDNDVTNFSYGTFGFSNTSGNSYPDQLLDMSNFSYIPRGLGRTVDNFVVMNVSVPCFYVNISALTTYYLKISPGTFSGNVPQYKAGARAVRIA